MPKQSAFSRKGGTGAVPTVNTASSAQVREPIHQRGIEAWRRYQAWLGPLQEIPNAGVLTLATARRDGATRLRVTYRVAGAPEANLDKLAPAVDGVIAEQVKRLKAFIETGKPD